MLDEAVEKLRAAALDADDASGHFPAMYARVTDRIRTAVAAGRFADPAGMMQFAGAFADHYLRPLAGESPVPGCWRAAWDVAGDRRLLVVQHLLLGMNAHINHDLPLVVVELADRSGDLAAMRADFDAVNDVLAEAIPDVLADLGRVSRWVNLVAARGGGRAFNFSLVVARRQAWLASERLYRLELAERHGAAEELDRMVQVLAYLVTHPQPPVRWFLPVGRLLETRDPRRTTRSLLGPLA